MTANDFLTRLSNVRKSSGGWTALCPAHDDKARSLSIKESGGKILLRCFAGCQTQKIVSALNLTMKDLFDNSNGLPSNSPKKRIEAIYEYKDENGKLLYENVRFNPKDFRQRCLDADGREVWNLDGIRRVPYRLPELIKAVADGADVFLCEGEKDADNLQKLGLTASSFKNWKPEFNQFLNTAHVTLIQDHDQSGLKQSNDSAKILFGNVESLRILDFFQGEPVPEKHGKDVSDWIEVRKKELSSDEEIAEKLCIFAANVDAWQPNQEIDVSADEEIKIEPFPVPSEKCFDGLAGEFVKLIFEHTEADAFGLLIQFLVYFGNVIGRGAFFQVEGDKHFTNLFCVLVGDTASGRKGTSFGRVKEVFKGLDELHEKNCIVSGLASGEGLLYHVRDATEKTRTKGGKTENVIEDSGVSDKRLLITEGEFAQVLRVQGREGNTLSAFLRNLWDTGTARNLTKNSPLKTSDAQVSIIGHITKNELLACLDEVETANGYANRFLWACVRRSKFLPFGAKLDENEINAFKIRLKAKIEFARNIGQMYFSDEAKTLWANVYESLETSRFGFLAKITQRASPYVLRLSCIFALLDGKTEIERKHLEAGLSVWQYCEDSARFIFGERLGDKHADALLKTLHESENGLTRTEIRDYFHRNLDGKEISRVLQMLAEMNLIACEKRIIENSKRPLEVWFAKRH